MAMAAEQTPLAAIADLATDLSESDPDGVLRYFDSQMKDYGTIEADIEALTAQADISCAIDIVKDDESNGVHKLDLDVFMDSNHEAATRSWNGGASASRLRCGRSKANGRLVPCLL
jgi:hypothetical protein